MPEAGDNQPSPYVTLKEDKDNAGNLKPDVAYQLHQDIREESRRKGLDIKPGDSPEETARKNRALKDLFDQRSASDLPDYQAAEIVALEEKASRDPLTGLLNRRGLDLPFADILKESGECGLSAIFLMLDLDYFKKMNDEHGHPIGDEALKYLARALTEAVEIEDLVARWGGEEFVVVIKPRPGQPAEQTELLKIAERIRLKVVDSLSEVIYRPADNQPEFSIPITLSVGATITRPDDTLETVYQRADEHLYQAKNSGRDQSIGDNGKITLLP